MNTRSTSKHGPSTREIWALAKQAMSGRDKPPEYVMHAAIRARTTRLNLPGKWCVDRRSDMSIEACPPDVTRQMLETIDEVMPGQVTDEQPRHDGGYPVIIDCDGIRFNIDGRRRLNKAMRDNRDIDVIVIHARQT